jgi:hypothetical protein
MRRAAKASLNANRRAVDFDHLSRRKRVRLGVRNTSPGDALIGFSRRNQGWRGSFSLPVRNMIRRGLLPQSAMASRLAATSCSCSQGGRGGRAGRWLDPPAPCGFPVAALLIAEILIAKRGSTGGA